MSFATDLPGFADPVAESQHCFRAVLDAMARPGSLHGVGAGLHPPPSLAPATASVLLTLIDSDTPLFLDPELAAALNWIAFHCGASCVAQRETASFIVTAHLPDLSQLQAGSHEAPETSATVILQIDRLGRGKRLRLRGPGLRVPSELSAEGLPSDFAALWQDNHARYPLGIDLILCADRQIAALPRSVSVEEA